MTVNVDYYDVLKVGRAADSAAIEAAVKKSMREWRKRTEAADLSVRQEAELKVKQIEEARATLLNQAQRAAYDRALASGVKQPDQPKDSTTSGGDSWLDQSERYLAVGDYHSAAYAARQATQTMGDSARSWWVRSRANSGLNLWQDALYEAKQAVALEENNADYHYELGVVQEELGQYNDAINSFRRAGACDPSNPLYELSVGVVHLSAGHPEQALPLIQTVYAKHPNDENANYYLGATLLELAQSVPKVRDGDSFAVTSAAEIQQMRDLATRAKSLKIVDTDIRRDADDILQYLDKMERKVFRSPRHWLGGVTDQVVDAGSDRGCLGMVVAFALVGVILFLPLVLLISAFTAFNAGNAGLGLILLLLTIGSGWLWWRNTWVPAWKRNEG